MDYGCWVSASMPDDASPWSCAQDPGIAQGSEERVAMVERKTVGLGMMDDVTKHFGVAHHRMR